MRSSFGVLTLLALASAGLAGSTTPPRLEAPQPVVDRGTVTVGEPLEVEFLVTNSGGEELVISVRPTCGCTVVDFDQRIAAGGSGKIHATVDTHRLRGRVSKSILITSNDPDSPTSRLVVSATVKGVLAALPAPLVHLDTVQGTPAYASVVVAATGDRDFTITEVESGAPYVTAVARRLGAAEVRQGWSATQFEVVLGLTGDAPPGQVDTTVKLYTDQGPAVSVDLRVVGLVRLRS